jgi:succinate dehydrogenase/fumarate reductase flavoprotein subunit
MLDTFSADVLIIGSGAAGLKAAIAAADAGCRVLVLSKGLPAKGTSTIMSLGVFAGAPGGEPAEHRKRTLAAGRAINQTELVDALIEEGPQVLQEIMDWGVRAVTRNGLLFTMGRPPVWVDDVLQGLLARAADRAVRFMGGMVVARLSVADGTGAVLAYSTVRKNWCLFSCKSLILATGGAGALYLRHDNPQRMLGEGYALALDTGAVLQDLEFVQFYPLGLAEDRLPPFLVPGRMADKGDLYNGKREEIHQKYAIQERPAAVRARDRLSQAIFTEVYREGETVWIDLTGLSEEDWFDNRPSSFFAEILGGRYRAQEKPVRVAPMAHHVMGGIKIDVHGASSVPGLFAAGEVTGGLHGANRMGGNALTETLVFGARAGSAAASWAKESAGGRAEKFFDELRSFIPRAAHDEATMTAAELKRELQRVMWEDGGILRNRSGLLRALNRAEDILEKAAELAQRRPQELPGAVEIRLGAESARLILQAAVQREESRGAHFREDHPNPDDRWRGHLQVRRLPSGESQWNFVPVSEVGDSL